MLTKVRLKITLTSLCLSVVTCVIASSTSHAQSGLTSYPLPEEVEDASKSVRERMGSYSAYQICQDYAEEFGRQCTINGWSCRPIDLQCPNVPGHAINLVYIGPDLCMLADPTSGGIIPGYFSCSEFLRSGRRAFSSPYCGPNVASCVCQVRDATGGWGAPTSDPKFFANNLRTYFAWVMLDIVDSSIGGRSRLQMCLGQCDEYVSSFEDMYRMCMNAPASNKDICRRLRDSAGNWREDCRLACTAAFG
jgi:hypothetical protein